LIHKKDGRDRQRKDEEVYSLPGFLAAQGHQGGGSQGNEKERSCDFTQLYVVDVGLASSDSKVSPFPRFSPLLKLPDGPHECARFHRVVAHLSLQVKKT